MRPNILVFICHDLGQHLNCYGQSEVRSPNIDAFAESGVRFENSFCAAPQCSPSRAAFWTGRFPHANGVVGLTHSDFDNDLNMDETHLVQILREAGYETHLFGIQHEASSAERCGYEHVHQRNRCLGLAEEFKTFLAERPVSDQPFFASIGTFEPHRPFPHEGVEPLPHDRMNVPPYLPDLPTVREDLAEMEASVAALDNAFGRVLEAIRQSPVADNMLVIFTTDHGIPFPYAKMSLNDAGLQTALIMGGTGMPSGVVHQPMISNVDMLPTLLDILGLPYPYDLHGRSFRALLTGDDYTPNEYIFGEKTYHSYYDPMRAVRTERWKLIANFEHGAVIETPPDPRNNGKSYWEVATVRQDQRKGICHPPLELYDLQADPHELTNLADEPEHRVVRDRLVKVLHRWMIDTGDPLLDGPMDQGAYRRLMADFKALALH